MLKTKDRQGTFYKCALGDCDYTFISFALNNIITMSPLIGLSEGYARANESFYASTLVIELIGSAILSPIMEELVFRGIVFGNMRKIMNVPQAVFCRRFCLDSFILI